VECAGRVLRARRIANSGLGASIVDNTDEEAAARYYAIFGDNCLATIFWRHFEIEGTSPANADFCISN
jgi:hypothetical protein